MKDKKHEPTFEGGNVRYCLNCKRPFPKEQFMFRCPTCRKKEGWMRGGTVANHRAYGGRV